MLAVLRAVREDGRGMTQVPAKSEESPDTGVVVQFPRPSTRSKWVRPSVSEERTVELIRALPRGIYDRIRILDGVGLTRKDGTFSPCWLWIGRTNGCATNSRNGGYPRFEVLSVTVAVHRWVYEFFFGKIKGKRNQLDHECRHRCCVNPFHLEQVTQRMNLKRAVASRKLERGCGVAQLDIVCDPC